MRHKKKLRRNSPGVWIGTVLLIFGILLVAGPDLKTWCQHVWIMSETESFQRHVRSDNSDSETEKNEENKQGEALWETIQKYNVLLCQEGQRDFMDGQSEAGIPEFCEDTKDRIFGYIEIPSIQVTLPLYLGSSESHMAKGAAVLSGTSIPVGGVNTNSVICGHRGYRGMPYFRDIEDLQTGDLIYITNIWGTLTYRAESVKVIDPSDRDAVMIQENRDMITLLTCHPYRSQGKYRYLVYCVRDETAANEEKQIKENDSDESQLDFQNDIWREDTLRKCSAAMIAVMAGLLFVRNKKEEKCK